MFKAKILEIGPLVPDFKEENLLVLFGKSAPPELREFSVIHDSEKQSKNVIKKEGILRIGNDKYTIRKVGDEANKNLYELGHLSIYFGENNGQEVLPGAILVTPNVFPDLEINDLITFE